MFQGQVQSILQELISLFTGEEKHGTINEDETPSRVSTIEYYFMCFLKQNGFFLFQKSNRLTEPKALVELENFLNAKFGAQTMINQLRDWFVHSLKQSSNTLLSAQH